MSRRALTALALSAALAASIAASIAMLAPGDVAARELTIAVASGVVFAGFASFKLLQLGATRMREAHPLHYAAALWASAAASLALLGFQGHIPSPAVQILVVILLLVALFFWIGGTRLAPPKPELPDNVLPFPATPAE